MILPNGDVDEIIAVSQALNNQDFTDLNTLVLRNRAEQILVIVVDYAPDGSWKMMPESYGGTENAFYGISTSGYGMETLMDGWLRLNNKMAFEWQKKHASDAQTDATYYARLKVDQMADWGHLEKDLKKMGFLENLTLQGVMPEKFLLRFHYSNGIPELMRQLDKAGWIFQMDSSNLGTLKRKELDENTL